MKTKSVLPYLALTFGLCATAQAQSLALPNASASAELPFREDVLISSTPMTSQIFFGASQVFDLEVGVSITGLSFRLDATASAAWPATTASFSDYEITLGQRNTSFSGASLNFAANLINPVLVRDGALEFAPNSFSAGGSPNAWGVTIEFDTPYTYEGGPLVLLFSHTGRVGGSGIFLDAASNTSGAFGVFDEGFHSTTWSATEGSSEATALLLHLAVVPEPQEYAAIAGVGLLAFAGWRRAQLRNKQVA